MSAGIDTIVPIPPYIYIYIYIERERERERDMKDQIKSVGITLAIIT